MCSFNSYILLFSIYFITFISSFFCWLYRIIVYFIEPYILETSSFLERFACNSFILRLAKYSTFLSDFYLSSLYCSYFYFFIFSKASLSLYFRSLLIFSFIYLLTKESSRVLIIALTSALFLINSSWIWWCRSIFELWYLYLCWLYSAWDVRTFSLFFIV